MTNSVLSTALDALQASVAIVKNKVAAAETKLKGLETEVDPLFQAFIDDTKGWIASAEAQIENLVKKL